MVAGVGTSYSFPVEFFVFGGETPLGPRSWPVTAQAEPRLPRFSLSHFPEMRSTWKLIGLLIVARPFSDVVRFVNVTRSSDMGVVSSRLTIDTTTGLRSVAVFATAVEKLLLSCQRSLSLIHTTAS